MLALLARPAAPLPAAPLREAVESLFRSTCTELTPAGLQDLVRVVGRAAEQGNGTGEGLLVVVVLLLLLPLMVGVLGPVVEVWAVGALRRGSAWHAACCRWGHCCSACQAGPLPLLLRGCHTAAS